MEDLQKVYKSKEKFIRQNLETIILSLLQQQPMCGYEIIVINQKFNIFMSPGTVYPLLYSLEGRDILKSEVRGGGMRRMKLYSLIELGNDRIKSKTDEFARIKKISWFDGLRGLTIEASHHLNPFVWTIQQIIQEL